MRLDGVWLGPLMKNSYRDGVYDFTNYSTLRQWLFVLTPADVAWGAVASAPRAAPVRIVVR
jgi:uncharacterized membrane protein